LSILRRKSAQKPQIAASCPRNLGITELGISSHVAGRFGSGGWVGP
jgi:hypothetical protein